MNRPSTPEVNRIYTGDAVSVLGTWPSQFVDLSIADPPYGNGEHVAYGRSRRRILGDEHPLVGLQGIAATYRVLKPNTTAYVFCAAPHIGLLEHFVLRYTKFRLRELLVWNKTQPGFGNTFRRAFECIAVLEKGEPRYQGQAISTVLTYRRTSTALHPHAKPLELLERLIQLSSTPDALVLDPFAGSGSTCVAALGAGRRFLGIELSPDYAEIARTRIRDAA